MPEDFTGLSYDADFGGNVFCVDGRIVCNVPYLANFIARRLDELRSVFGEACSDSRLFDYFIFNLICEDFARSSPLNEVRHE